MEDPYINSEASSEFTVTVKELAAMNIPGYPSTDRAWLNLVKRDGWRFIEVQGRGRGGVYRKYAPPPAVLALIEARQRGDASIGDGGRRGGNETLESASAKLAGTMRRMEQKNGLCYISVTLLARCLDAVDENLAVKSRQFSTVHRLAAAIDAYRLLTEKDISEPLDYAAFSTLGKDEFNAAATLALWSKGSDETNEEEESWIISSFIRPSGGQA